MCSDIESVIPCITYVMIWVSLYTIANYALCVCRHGIILMLRQESSLNDDPSFMAHEPKWCLSDSIKGLDKHQNSERQTHQHGGRLSGTNIFLPLPACVLLGNIYHFASMFSKNMMIFLEKLTFLPKTFKSFTRGRSNTKRTLTILIFCSTVLLGRFAWGFPSLNFGVWIDYGVSKSGFPSDISSSIIVHVASKGVKSAEVKG